MRDRCNNHPLAPHGFNLNASYSEDRYVCDCEIWSIQDAIDDLHPALVAQIEADVLRRVARQWDDDLDTELSCEQYMWEEADRILKEAADE